MARALARLRTMAPTDQGSSARSAPTHRRALHWEAWLLRLALLGVLGYQLATGNKDGAMVAGEGLVVSLLPLLVEHFSHTHIPRALEAVFVLTIALQFISESLKLFEVFYYWDKIVHPGEIALSSMIFAWLLLGYRDVFAPRLSDHLVAAAAMLLGATLGAFWEFIEFVTDWFGDANLQKSNGDTMTDMIANDLGTFVATLVALWIYHQWIGANQRRQMGQVADWLTGGPGKLLAHHGRLVGAALAVAFVALLGGTQWVLRDPPALAAGLAAGEARTFAFAGAQAPQGDTQVLRGDWVPDQRGICRENLEHPKPGSEKMGLLELDPGSAYGQGSQPFSASTRYYEERPPKTEGSEMDAGVAFGIRGADDFYLLEENALHDILRLDRYAHGKRHDVREKLYRTHGDEWHTLSVDVRAGHVAASIDGQEIYAVDGLPDTAGGVGLWARAAAATCFADAQVQVGQPATTAMVPLPAVVE